VDDPSKRDSVYSFGHRNAQGMTVHPETGEIWQSEHGEQDGDEINIIEKGGNYGWPVADHGCPYGGDEPIGDRPEERSDLVMPVYYWPCGSGGFPPGGMTFYDGDAFPAWQGDLFVGTLGGRHLGRFPVDGRTVEDPEALLMDRGWRIRAVEIAPDTGHLYLAVDAPNAPLVRLVPA
jgi:glucose/arabinose dehydrogenase